MRPQEVSRCTADTKKGLLAAVPQDSIPEIILTRSGSTDALRQLQNKRFKQRSQRIYDPADWLMWMFPTNAGSFVHRMVDRLMLGDAKAEAQVAQVREDMGL